MTRFAYWCGFLGAWLLFAGPLHQAESELDAEAREASAFYEMVRSTPRPPSPSPWWWVLPPVAVVLHIRQGRSAQRALRAMLSAEQTALLVRFSEKALGWQLVAGGACLIAVDETWFLVHAYHWPTLVFWLLVAAMIAASLGFTAVRAHRRYDILGLQRGHGGGPPAGGAGSDPVG